MPSDTSKPKVCRRFCAAFLCSNLASAGRWALSNDGASDLLVQIVPGGGVDAVGGALDAAMPPISPIDDEQAARALAAAELVAAMVGRPSRNLSAPYREWATHSPVLQTVSTTC